MIFARLQRLGQFVDVAAAHAVDDPRFPFVPVEQFKRLLVLIVARHDVVHQVRPVEIADEHFGRCEPQLRDDVGPHLFGRRRREGVQRGLRKDLFQFAQLAIFGAKIVSPMADAMGLVDGEAAHVDLFEQRAESAGRQPFGRGEQQPDRAVEHCPLARPLFVRGDASC